MKVNRISAVTIFTKDMAPSCSFYSKLPMFELIYGGPTLKFSTFKISNSLRMYLNIELSLENAGSNFGRIIFHTDDVDALYHYLKNEEIVSQLDKFETEPADASWGERFFYMRDPDGHLIAFATPF